MEENNSHPPKLTSNRIANRPPINSKTLELRFKSFNPLPKTTKTLATSPNHPILSGTTP